MALKSFTVAPAGKGTPTVSVGIVRTSKVTPAGKGTPTVTVGVARASTVAPAGKATAVVSVGITRALVVAPAGVSTVAITVRMKRALSVAPGGVAGVTLVVGARRQITLSAAGSSSVTTGFVDQHPAAVAPAGHAGAALVFTMRRALSVVAGGIATASPAPQRWRDVTVGPIPGVSTATLAFIRWRFATATVSGASTASVTVAAIRAVSASAAGLSSVALLLIDIPGIPGLSSIASGGQSTVVVNLSSIVAPGPSAPAGGGGGRIRIERRTSAARRPGPAADPRRTVGLSVVGRSTVNLSVVVRRSGTVLVGDGALAQVRPTISPTIKSHPAESNREPALYESAALPVELGRRGATSVVADGNPVSTLRPHTPQTASAVASTFGVLALAADAAPPQQDSRVLTTSAAVNARATVRATLEKRTPTTETHGQQRTASWSPEQDDADLEDVLLLLMGVTG